MDKGIKDNESDYKCILWIFFVVMLLVIIVIIFSWIVMCCVLLLLLQDVISYICVIVVGDLIQLIYVEGKNEMVVLV